MIGYDFKNLASLLQSGFYRKRINIGDFPSGESCFFVGYEDGTLYKIKGLYDDTTDRRGKDIELIIDQSGNYLTERDQNG